MKILKNKSGVAILLVMIYFLVLNLLLVALFYVTIGNFNNQNTSTSNTSSYYVAESGINLALAQFEDEIDSLKSNQNLNLEQFSAAMMLLVSTINNADMDILYPFSDSLGTSQLDVTITPSIEDGYQVFEIISNGTIDNVTRTLKKVIRFEYAVGPGNGFAISKAVLTSGKIRTSLDTKIINIDGSGADVESYTKTAGDIYISSASTFGDIYLLNDAPSNTVASPSGTTTLVGEYKPFPIIDFSYVDSKAQTIVSNTTNKKSNLVDIIKNNKLDAGTYYIETIELGSNMTFEVPGDTFIVTNKIEFKNNFKTINVTGNGKLEIYVGNPNSSTPSNQILFSNLPNGFSIGHSTNPAGFIVYVSSFLNSGAIPTITFNQNSIFYGSLMLENARLNFLNNSTVSGYLVTNAVDQTDSQGNVTIPVISISNNGSLSTKGLMFAPQGTVKMVNNSYFTGSIVSKNVDITKGTLVYDPLGFIGMPFVINDPINQTGFSGGFVINYNYDSTTEID